MKGFSREQLQRIGFDYVMGLVDTRNCYGEEIKKNVVWYSDHDKRILSQQIRYLTKLIKFQKSHPETVVQIRNILHRFKDIRGILRKIEKSEEHLDETELFEVKNFAIDLEYLLLEYNKAKLDLKKIRPFSTRKIIKLLNPDGHVTRTFAIYNTYSKKLTALRKRKLEIEKQILLCGGDRNLLLQKRVEITIREKIEENLVKLALTYKLRKYIEKFKTNIRFIGELDFLLARSDLAIRFDCSKPVFSDRKSIKANDIINPYVDNNLQNNWQRFTPISITMKCGANVLTGANMGGKTVALATITLNILLAHCGFFVFGKSLKLPIFDSIVYLSHDYQSIELGLSSFGAEVKELTRLIHVMRRERVFCALDEFAKGTNPEEGEILVRAFLRLAEQYRTFALVSTHFSGVLRKGMNHFQVVGLRNTDLSKFSAINELPSPGMLQQLMDYRIGKVGWNSLPPREAVRVAELMGIQNEFLDLVKENYQEK